MFINTVRPCCLVLKYVYHILPLHPLHNKYYSGRISAYRAVKALGFEADHIILCNEILAFVLRSVQNTSIYCVGRTLEFCVLNFLACEVTTELRKVNKLFRKCVIPVVCVKLGKGM